MKIHVLGTGHADVLDEYNTCFCIENGGILLVDSGGGNRVIKQLALANIQLENIESAFISHNHGDHILGFAWILRYVLLSFGHGGRKKTFTIYGSADCLETIKFLALKTLGSRLCEKYFGSMLLFVPVEDGQQEKLLGLTFNFFNTHAQDMPQMGFQIKEKRFCFAGDVPLSEKNQKRFKKQNWLCLEAFCLENERTIHPLNSLALQKHRTVEEAAQIATQVEAKNLILWHSADNHNEKQAEYLNAAKQHFSGEIFVPKDLDVIEIK